MSTRRDWALIVRGAGILRFEPNWVVRDPPGRNGTSADDLVAIGVITKLLLSPSSIHPCQLSGSTFSRQAIERMEEKKVARAVTGGNALAGCVTWIHSGSARQLEVTALRFQLAMCRVFHFFGLRRRCMHARTTIRRFSA